MFPLVLLIQSLLVLLAESAYLVASLISVLTVLSPMAAVVVFEAPMVKVAVQVVVLVAALANPVLEEPQYITRFTVHKATMEATPLIEGEAAVEVKVVRAVPAALVLVVLSLAG